MCIRQPTYTKTRKAACVRNLAGAAMTGTRWWNSAYWPNPDCI